MKKILSLLTYLTFTFAYSFGQSNLAKLKYEEAEEAYAANNYELTITRLKEVEAELKATNPKTLYLKINAMAAIVNKDPYNDFNLLNSTRKLCDKYLTDYGKLANNEEKFRDIYKISSKLEGYPLTASEFDLKKTSMQQNAENQKTAELNKQKAADEIFKKHVFYSGYTMGLTLDQMLVQYPYLKKHYKFKQEPGFAIAAKDQQGSAHPTGFYMINNKIWGYYGTVLSLYVDDANYSVGTKKTDNIVNTLTSEFQFKPTEEVAESTTKSQGADFYTKTISYIWKKYNKTVSVVFSKSNYLGDNLSSLSIVGKDEDLLK